MVAGYAPTCTEAGLTDGTKCSVCGTTTLAQQTIPAMGHTDEVVEGYAATCTETGLTNGTKCSACGTTTLAQQTIDALGHGDVIVVDELSDTIECTVCNAQFRNTTAEVYETTERICPEDCTGENCTVHNLFVTVTGTKKPDAPYAIDAENVTAVDFDKAVSFILVSGSEEVTYVIELLDADDVIIATIEASGTEYIDVYEYADKIDSVQITATGSATAYFYALV